MYSSLKTNFYSMCLDSVFLNKSSIKRPSFYGSRSSLHHRRRITFISHLLRLRTTFRKYISTLFFVKDTKKISHSVFRSLYFVRFFSFLSRAFSRTGLSISGNHLGSGSYVCKLVSHLRSNNLFPRTVLLRSLRREKLSPFSQSLLKKFKKSVVIRNLVFSKRIFYFFSRLFRQFTSMSHTCYYYFRMMLGGACLFKSGAGRVSFFFKKLMRLFFYQLCLRVVSDVSAVPSTNFKTVACAGLLVDSSIISYSLGMRLLNYLILDFVSFIQIITSIRLPVSPYFSGKLLQRVSKFIGFLSFSRGFSINFFSSIVKFLSSFFMFKYRFLFNDTTSVLRKTFNFYVNNSSARNVYSALNRGSKMLYGTTSGSFKLKKRIRFKKHAMFMVAAKFNRNISHYYKSKLVRSLYIHFTGFRRSFNLVFQFFRNIIRKNAKYHFKPVNALFKFQPFATTKYNFYPSVGASSLLSRTLPLHIKSIKYGGYNQRIPDVFSFVSRHSKHNLITASNLFLSGIFYNNKRKLVMPLFNHGVRTFHTALYYSKYTKLRHLPFLLSKSSVAVSSTQNILFPLVTSTTFTISKSCSLSPWLYSSVYSSIIRTRRQYKLYKKLIVPILSRTRVDCSDFDVHTSFNKSSSFFFSRLRRKLLFFIHTAVSRTSGAVSYNSVLLNYNTLFSSCSRFYSTSAMKRSGSSPKKQPAFSKKSAYAPKKRNKIGVKKRGSSVEVASFRSKMNSLTPTTYLSVFRTRMAIFLNTIFSGSTVRYRPVISHGGCYRRKRNSDRRYWF